MCPDVQCIQCIPWLGKIALLCQIDTGGLPNPVSNTDGNEVQYGQQETHRPRRGARAVRQHLRRTEVRDDAGRRPPPPSPSSPWSLGLGTAAPAAASALLSWLVRAASASAAPAAVLPASLLVRLPLDGVQDNLHPVVKDR